MGCASSSSGGDKNMKVATQRRRLSIGEVDNSSGGDGGGDNAEADRGMIATLAEDDILALCQDSGGRKFSLGSATDAGKQSFANKTLVKDGDTTDTTGIGYTCRKGLKPESPNQDSWSVLQVEGKYSIYGVYDGHGKTGHDVSNFVKDNLPKILIKDQRFADKDFQVRSKLYKESFMKMQSLVGTMDRMKKLSAQMAGTTCSIVCHNTEEGEFGKLTVAHVADSTVVLGTKTGSTYSAKALTRDHKPDLKDERQRIEKAGGRVIFDGYANHRVYAKNGRYPGLNMSRCLGDLLGHQDAGCSCEPEVSEHTLTENDKILLVCSDGVWEFISPKEAVDICVTNSADPQKAADNLAKEAWDRWIKEEGGSVVDDITVILVYLDKQKKTAENGAAKPAGAE